MLDWQLQQATSNLQALLAGRQIANNPRRRTADRHRFPLVAAIRNADQDDVSRTNSYRRLGTRDPQKVLPNRDISDEEYKSLGHLVVLSSRSLSRQPKTNRQWNSIRLDLNDWSWGLTRKIGWPSKVKRRSKGMFATQQVEYNWRA